MKSERLALRASAVLPGAGAYDAAPTAVLLPEAPALDLHVLYTTHALSATGRPALRLQFSCDPPTTAPGSVAHWEDDVILDGATLAKASGWWSLEGGGQEIRLPTPGVAATQRCWRLGSIQTRGAHWVRCAFAEHGDVAQPGTVEAYLVAELP